MGRPRTYTRDAVLEKAMGAFWQNGYKATSVNDIVRESGLNTASLYKEFGDKDGIFLEALEYYRGHVIGPRYQILRDNPDMAGVETFLKNVMKGAEKSEYKGCLMMNHLAQKHAISTEAAEMIEDFCATMEGLLETALRNAQAEGALPGDKDPAALASYIMCCVHGMVLYGRHPNKKDEIRKIQAMILQTTHA